MTKMRIMRRDNCMKDYMSCFVYYYLYILVLSTKFLLTVANSSNRASVAAMLGDFDRLTVWIEGKEIEHFLGFPLDIYIIQDGIVESYLQDAYMDTQLPILPPEVTKVEISWMGRDDDYGYNFPDLRSLDPHVMFDPLMSIPTYGHVPRNKSTFHITLSCTGVKTGIASMYLSLAIVDSSGYHIPGSPVKLHIRKRCIAFAESKTDCVEGCKHGGTCNSGKCLCKKGYFGSYCQYVACYPACKNNGTCVEPGKCVCPKGYSGTRCQKVRCKDKCSGRGTCIAPNTCSCPREYYGDKCQFKKDLINNSTVTVLTPVVDQNNETNSTSISDTEQVEIVTPFTGKCDIPCQNQGVCNEKNVCQCKKGYVGQFCQNPVCKKSCGVHGYCVDVNTCECYRGWRGRFCHKTVHRLSNYNPENRRKHGRRRKQRHTKKSNKRRKRKRKKIFV